MSIFGHFCGFGHFLSKNYNILQIFFIDCTRYAFWWWIPWLISTKCEFPHFWVPASSIKPKQGQLLACRMRLGRGRKQQKWKFLPNFILLSGSEGFLCPFLFQLMISLTVLSCMVALKTNNSLPSMALSEHYWTFLLFVAFSFHYNQNSTAFVPFVVLLINSFSDKCCFRFKMCVSLIFGTWI